MNSYDDILIIAFSAIIVFGLLRLMQVNSTKVGSAKMQKTLYGLISELEARSAHIAAMNLITKVHDANLDGSLKNFLGRASDLDRIARAIDTLIAKANVSVSDAETALRQTLSERHFYGSYCELGAYDWLARNNVEFKAQINLPGSEVLNPNGCTLDGKFDILTGYFDIKAFGFQEYVAEKFRLSLEKKLPGLVVTLDGSMDVAVKDIESIAFARLDSLVTSLSAGGIGRIPELDWTIRAMKPEKITIETHSFAPYELAENNRFYPLKTASQFTRNAKFVLIFAFSAQFNKSIALNFGGSTDVTLRSLARRVFIQLPKDSSLANVHDKQVTANIKIGDAAKLISGLLFINLDNDSGWLYSNPNALHKFDEYHARQIFDFVWPPETHFDDFRNDNY